MCIGMLVFMFKGHSANLPGRGGLLKLPLQVSTSLLLLCPESLEDKMGQFKILGFFFGND